MKVPLSIRWRQGVLELLDQRRLPERVEYLVIESLDEAVDAIRTLAVRGAPAIGIAAAYALAVTLRDVTTSMPSDSTWARRPLSRRPGRKRVPSESGTSHGGKSRLGR